VPFSRSISLSFLVSCSLEVATLFSEPSSDAEYHRLEQHESAALRRQRSKSRRIWCAIIALTTGILGFIAVLAILRAVEDANHLAPTKRPVFPTQYEASVTFNMPYMDMVEPLYVHVDEVKGLQKLSYYGGTDVYIYNTSGTSYQIIPVIRERKCFKSGSESLQHIFPNMTLFEPQHGVFLVEGRPCFSWKFVTKLHEPTVDGLLGEYTLYVDQKTERPVRFHYVGRNGMLGGSHIDEYFLDYIYVREGPVDEHVFSSLPASMNCTDMPGDDGGPSRQPKADVRAIEGIAGGVLNLLVRWAGVDPYAVSRRHGDEDGNVRQLLCNARQGLRRRSRSRSAYGDVPSQPPLHQRGEPQGMMIDTASKWLDRFPRAE
jgi:hypothetical protein